MSEQTVSSADLGQMLISAVRYALPRRSYIVDMTVEWLEKYANLIQPEDAALIAEDIAASIYRSSKSANGANDMSIWVKAHDTMKRVAMSVSKNARMEASE